MHATICDCLADTVQNAIEAGATRIEVRLEEDAEAVKLLIRDNGKGMDDATLARVWDPFFTEPGKHARRRVGLGLPLLRQMVEAAQQVSAELLQELAGKYLLPQKAYHFSVKP